MLEPNSSAVGLFVAVFVVRLVHELSIGLKARQRHRGLGDCVAEDNSITTFLSRYL